MYLDFKYKIHLKYLNKSVNKSVNKFSLFLYTCIKLKMRKDRKEQIVFTVS